MNKFAWFMCGAIFWSCSSNGLPVSIFRGNHEKQRLERQVVVDGKNKWEVIFPNDPVFSDMQCTHKYDLQKIQKFYNACIKAGVKPE